MNSSVLLNVDPKDEVRRVLKGFVSNSRGSERYPILSRVDEVWYKHSDKKDESHIIKIEITPVQDFDREEIKAAAVLQLNGQKILHKMIQKEVKEFYF